MRTFIVITECENLRNICNLIKHDKRVVKFAGPQDIVRLAMAGYSVRRGSDSLIISNRLTGQRQQIDGRDNIINYIREEQRRWSF